MTSDRDQTQSKTATDPEETDKSVATLGFGDGGVPWYLLLLYLGFLVFFTWYTLEYQLPDFADQGPVPIETGVEK